MRYYQKALLIYNLENFKYLIFIIYLYIFIIFEIVCAIQTCITIGCL